jgi:hypothetical protein
MASPFPFSVGAVLTAAQMNSIGESLTYTPTAVNWTIGNATVTGRFVRVNKFVYVRVDIVWGTTSTVTGTGMQVSLPTASQNGNGNAPLGAVWWYDASAGAQVYGLVAGVDVNNVMFNAMSSDAANVGVRYSAAGSPFTLAVGDGIYMYFVYEAA